MQFGLNQKEIKTMNTQNIIRAWKNPEYRDSLSESERAALPANPAGRIEVAEPKSSPAIPYTFNIFCTWRYVCW
jgi:mersacidin/lichenicidin family type 2 lantibiotic